MDSSPTRILLTKTVGEVIYSRESKLSIEIMVPSGEAANGVSKLCLEFQAS